MTRPFERIAGEVGRLVTEKDAAYGSAIAGVKGHLALLFPNGIRPEQYRDLGLIVRTLDKLSRIATRKNAFGESPWRDVAGYAVVATALDEAEVVDGANGDLASAAHENALAEATCRFAGLSARHASEVLERGVLEKAGQGGSVLICPLTAAELEALEAIARRSP
jgi:hypothetical protein